MIPNFLSLLRFPLAFVFLQNDPLIRVGAICCAMMTDGLDGFVARRYNMKSRLGTFLDPFTDKFFVIFALVTFIGEGMISIPEVGALICRDFAVILFGIYLAISGKLSTYRFRAIWCGKASTFLQFVVLLGLTFQVSIPGYFYLIFITLGILALIELYISQNLPPKSSQEPG